MRLTLHKVDYWNQGLPCPRFAQVYRLIVLLISKNRIIIQIMKFAVLADIHGNLEALKAVLETIKGVDEYLVLGDTVGYGPEPDECVSAVRHIGPISIAGNHDRTVTDDVNLDLYSDELRENLMWTKKRVSPENLMVLRSVPEHFLGTNFEMVHGSLRQPLTEYISDVQTGAMSIELMKKKILFTGHLHVPLLILKDKDGKFDGWQLNDGDTINLAKFDKAIVNPGAVGQPRDMDPRASYGIFDDEKMTFELRRVKYDIEAVQKKMRKLGIFDFYAERLKFGR